MNSILDRVYRVCNTIRQQNQESISFKKLIGSTRKSFKDYNLDVLLRTSKDENLLSNEFYVEAYYYEEKDFNEDPPIEIIVYHNFEISQRFRSSQITDFLIQVFDATVHELRHQVQHLNRDYDHFSTNKEGFAAYLADPDEVDAYAFSIAIELMRHLPKNQAVLYMTRMTVLSRLKKNGTLVSPNLQSYVAHFGNTLLLKKLAKKVYKHLATVDSSLIFK